MRHDHRELLTSDASLGDSVSQEVTSIYWRRRIDISSMDSTPEYVEALAGALNTMMLSYIKDPDEAASLACIAMESLGNGRAGNTKLKK